MPDIVRCPVLIFTSALSIFSKITKKILMLSVWNFVLFPQLKIQSPTNLSVFLETVSWATAFTAKFLTHITILFVVTFLSEKLPILKESSAKYKNEGSSVYSKSSRFKRPTRTGSGTARTSDRTSPIRKVSRTQKSWRHSYKTGA